MKRSLEEEGITVSESQIRRVREQVGYEPRIARAGFLVSPANEKKRLAYCEQLLASNETFTNWVFSDESRVQLGGNGKVVWVKSDDPTAHIIPRPQSPLGLMVWGGISMRGPTDLIIIRKGDGVDAAKYQKILDFFREWAKVG